MLYLRKVSETYYVATLVRKKWNYSRKIKALSEANKLLIRKFQEQPTYRHKIVKVRNRKQKFKTIAEYRASII